jgi:hypothetical protein
MAAMWLARCYLANSSATLEKNRTTAEQTVVHCEETPAPGKARASEPKGLASELLESIRVPVDAERGSMGFGCSLARALARFPLM